MDPRDLGLDVGRMVAGFAGGLVSAFLPPAKTAWAVIGSIVGGTLTANFLTPAATHYSPNWLGDGGVGFILGLTAMIICQGIIVFAVWQLKKFGAKFNGAK